jgi:methylthioribose-1-phosphate isomerase
MTLIAIAWDDAGGRDGRGAVRLLDQTLLPGTTEHREIDTTDALVVAIAELAVRGAPALGVAGALGVVLAMDEGAREDWDDGRVQAAVDRVRHARPTAVNLAWGVDQVRPLMGRGRDAVLAAARRVAVEDEAANRELSRQGADWLLARIDRPRLRVLTHCNTGSLATSAWGTALGVVRELHARDRLELVYADETRPLLQGARLTAWELRRAGVAHEIVVDGAAPGLIARGEVDAVITGCDRVAANGDVANKVGTYPLALAAQAADIPFVVAGPTSSIDPGTPTGAEIAIEERPPDEVRRAGGAPLALPDTPVRNPAFDLTPAALVTALVTEHGVARPVSSVTVRALLDTRGAR